MKQASIVAEMWTDQEESPDLYDHYSAYTILLAGKVHEGSMPNDSFFIKGKKYRITIKELAE